MDAAAGWSHSTPVFACDLADTSRKWKPSGANHTTAGKSNLWKKKSSLKRSGQGEPSTTQDSDLDIPTLTGLQSKLRGLVLRVLFNRR